MFADIERTLKQVTSCCLAHRTVAHTMNGHWHHTVVRLSVCDAVYCG